MGALMCELPNGKTFRLGSGYVLNPQISTQKKNTHPHPSLWVPALADLVYNRFDDAERADPPPIGAIVTFRYQELTPAGIPRFPTFVCVRIDATWPPQ